jgi:hypothetical protein
VTLSRVWEIRTVEGGANGLEFARAELDASHDAVLVHAAPSRIRVEVTDSAATLVASGDDLRDDEDTPMARLEVDGLRVVRRNVWPRGEDIGMPVILPGGEAGILRAWWNAEDRSEWRWEVEFHNAAPSPVDAPGIRV